MAQCLICSEEANANRDVFKYYTAKKKWDKTERSGNATKAITYISGAEGPNDGFICKNCRKNSITFKAKIITTIIVIVLNAVIAFCALTNTWDNSETFSQVKALITVLGIILSVFGSPGLLIFVWRKYVGAESVGLGHLSYKAGGSYYLSVDDFKKFRKV
ncbi:MAG: hypothetical protein FWH26_11560 [Oscillospiraceae bacterium]|nr:hypothetical protein [Oscillospiraceae bacterium]